MKPQLSFVDQLRADLESDMAAGPLYATQAARKRDLLASATTEGLARREVERLRIAKRDAQDELSRSAKRISALTVNTAPELFPTEAVAAERAMQAKIESRVERLSEQVLAALKTWNQSRLLLADFECLEAASMFRRAAARRLVTKRQCRDEFAAKSGLFVAWPTMSSAELERALVVLPTEMVRAEAELAAEIAMVKP